MTGDDNGDGIGSIGGSHGAHCVGMSDGLGKLSIRGGGAAGNLAQGAPDVALERRAGSADGDLVNCAEFAGEVFCNQVGEAVWIGGRRESESVCAVVVAELAEDRLVAVSEECDAQVAFLVGDETHDADGSGEVIEKELEDAGHEWAARKNEMCQIQE